MKKILTTLALTLSLTGAAFAQEISPSGDGCWTPVEAGPVLVQQAFTLIQTLTEEEVATVKANVTRMNPSGIYDFTYIEFWDTTMDEKIWVAVYEPNPANDREVCFIGFFPQTQAQILEVLAPVE